MSERGLSERGQTYTLTRLKMRQRALLKTIATALFISYLIPNPILFAYPTLRPAAFDGSGRQLPDSPQSGNEAAYLPGEHTQRLHIYYQDAKFFYTAEGAMISKEVDLANIQTSPENIANTFISGAKTVIEKDVQAKSCWLEDVYLKEGSRAYNSTLRTKWPEEGKDFADWQYNGTYWAKGGMLTIGKGCIVETSVLTNAMLADNTRPGDETRVTRCVLADCRVGKLNRWADVKGNLFYSRHDVKIEGPVEVSEAWFGWGFRHIPKMKIGFLEFERNPIAYLEGLFLNEIVLHNRVVENVPAIMCISQGIYCSYDGKLKTPEGRVVTDIHGKKSRKTGQKESSAHYYYATEPFAAIAPRGDVRGVRIVGLPWHPASFKNVYAENDVTYMTACSFVGGEARDPLDGREHWGIALGRSIGLSPNKDIPADPFMHTPLLIIAFGEELRNACEREGIDVKQFDGLFEDILLTKELNTPQKGKGRDNYHILRKSGVFKYENGRFINWGVNPKTHKMESLLFEYKVFPHLSGANQETLEAHLANPVSVLIGYRGDDLPRYETVFDEGEMASFSQAQRGHIADRLRPDIERRCAEGKLYVHPGAVIESGVILNDGVVIGPNVKLTGRIHVGEGARLGFMSAIGDDFIGGGSEIIYAMLNGRQRPVEMFENSSLVMTEATAARLGAETKACSAVVFNSRLGERNILEPFARVINCGYGNDNQIGSFVNRVRPEKGRSPADGTTNHHMFTMLDDIYLSNQQVIQADGRMADVTNQINFSAGSFVRGPAILEGAFIGALATIVGAPNYAIHCGAMSFIKNDLLAEAIAKHPDSDEYKLLATVDKDSQLSFYVPAGAYWDGRMLHSGEVHNPLKWGFEYVARAGMSKVLMVMPQDRKPLADRYLEQSWSEAIESDLRALERIDPTAADRVNDELEALISVVKKDFKIKDGPPSLQRRGELVSNALDTLATLKGEKTGSLTARMLKGIMKNVMVLSGNYYMRNGYFPGLWYKEGDYNNRVGARRPLWAWFPMYQPQKKVMFNNVMGEVSALPLWRIIDPGDQETPKGLRKFITMAYGMPELLEPMDENILRGHLRLPRLPENPRNTEVDV